MSRRREKVPRDGIEQTLRTTRQGDLHFGRVHSGLIGFHHHVGRSMNHYHEAAELLREEGHPGLAEQLLDPIGRGVISGRWSWSIVEEYEERFFEQAPDLARRLKENIPSLGPPEVAKNPNELNATDGGRAKTD